MRISPLACWAIQGALDAKSSRQILKLAREQQDEDAAEEAAANGLPIASTSASQAKEAAVPISSKAVRTKEPESDEEDDDDDAAFEDEDEFMGAGEEEYEELVRLPSEFVMYS